jgi:hypothetical protein
MPSLPLIRRNGKRSLLAHLKRWNNRQKDCDTNGQTAYSHKCEAVPFILILSIPKLSAQARISTLTRWWFHASPDKVAQVVSKFSAQIEHCSGPQDAAPSFVRNWGVQDEVSILHRRTRPNLLKELGWTRPENDDSAGTRQGLLTSKAAPKTASKTVSKKRILSRQTSCPHQ